MKIAVFGYGSLVSHEFLELTLGRPPEKLKPARLNGWLRSWSVVVANPNTENHPRFELNGTGEIPPSIVALNIERVGEFPEAQMNGTLIGLTEPELDFLDRREAHYDRVEVTNEIITPHDFDHIFAYTGQPQFTDRERTGPIIPSSYLFVVEEGFRQIGEQAIAEFHATTIPSKYGVADAVYVMPSHP